jgi:hypothetical protein
MYGAPRLANLSGRIPDRVDAAAIKRRAFHDHGILVVDVDDPALMLSWDQREILRQVGERLYGQRKVSKDGSGSRDVRQL